MEVIVDTWHSDSDDLCELFHAQRPSTLPTFTDITGTQGYRLLRRRQESGAGRRVEAEKVPTHRVGLGMNRSQVCKRNLKRDDDDERQTTCGSYAGEVLERIYYPDRGPKSIRGNSTCHSSTRTSDSEA